MNSAVPTSSLRDTGPMLADQGQTTRVVSSTRRAPNKRFKRTWLSTTLTAMTTSTLTVMTLSPSINWDRSSVKHPEIPWPTFIHPTTGIITSTVTIFHHQPDVSGALVIFPFFSSMLICFISRLLFLSHVFFWVPFLVHFHHLMIFNFWPK